MLAFRPRSVTKLPVGALALLLASLVVAASMITDAQGATWTALISPGVFAVCVLAYALNALAQVRREGDRVMWRSVFERGEASASEARLRRSVAQTGRSSMVLVELLHPSQDEPVPLLELPYSDANLRQVERVAEHLGLPLEPDAQDEPPEPESPMGGAGGKSLG